MRPKTLTLPHILSICTALFILFQSPCFVSSASAAEYGYVNYIDAVVTHPMMKFWDNENSCFLDIRGNRKLTHKELIEREEFFWRLQAIEDEKNNAGPLSTLKRSEWQAFHPNYKIEEFIEANKKIEEEYQETLRLNKLKKQQLLAEMREKGWSEKELFTNRKKSPEKVLAMVHRDIKKACDTLRRTYLLKAVLNSSSLNSRRSGVPYHLQANVLLSDHYSNIYYKGLDQMSENDQVSEKKEPNQTALNSDNLLNWYRSKDFILREFHTFQKKDLFLKNGIDLTSQVISMIQKDYLDKEKKSLAKKTGKKKNSKSGKRKKRRNSKRKNRKRSSR